MLTPLPIMTVAEAMGAEALRVPVQIPLRVLPSIVVRSLKETYFSRYPAVVSMAMTMYQRQ